MKILHVAPIAFLKNDLSPDEKSNSNFLKIGGLSTSVTNLAEGQCLNKFSVGVVTTRQSLRAVSENIYWKSVFANSFLKLLFNDPFHQIEKEFGLPEILHTHDIYEIKQLVFIYHAIRKNIKIYISPRGTLSPVALSRNRVKKILYMHLLLNPLVKYIDGFVALNEGEKKCISARYKNKKIIIISNGVDENYDKYIKYQSNYEEKSNCKIINIGFLGRFEIHIKGLDLLLNAYLEYQKIAQPIKIQVTFVGEHSKKRYDSTKYFKSIEEQLIDKSMIKLIGPFYNHDKWNAMSKFDIFIHPSRTEGMPNAVLEAMSVGIPCIVSPNTNMGEIVKSANCGWVIENNIEALLNHFMKLKEITKSELLELGINGMNYSKNNLTWKQVSKKKYI